MEKKIKSAEEILEECVREGFKDSFFTDEAREAAVRCMLYFPKDKPNYFILAMKIYAAQIVEAQLEIVTEEAYCDLVHPPTDEYPDLEESEVLVCKSSIRNCTRVNLE